MQNFDEQAASSRPQASRSHRSGLKWRLLGGMMLALALTLGIGIFIGAAPGSRQALAAGPGAPDGVYLRQIPTMMPTMMPRTPGACGGDLIVTQVNGRTITVTKPDGSTVTIHTTAHTVYTKGGHTVTAGAIVAGTHIYVVGSCNDQGRVITATSIEIVNG
jgi:hypothetical protein